MLLVAAEGACYHIGYGRAFLCCLGLAIVLFRDKFWHCVHLLFLATFPRMRLITHNMLKSNIKGVEGGFPLGIEVVKTEEQELEFNAGVIRCVLYECDTKQRAGCNYSYVITSG